jgi:hypothetical protein
MELCVEPDNDVGDRTELPPRVDVPGEIPEPQKDQEFARAGNDLMVR